MKGSRWVRSWLKVRCRRPWKPHYLVAAQDQAVPPEAERLFAARMDAVTVEVASGHLAMISDPYEVTRLIKDAGAGA